MEKMDISLKRLKEAAHVCGLIPRPCFEASILPSNIVGTTRLISNVIFQCKDLATAITGMHGDQPVPHCVFEICREQGLGSLLHLTGIRLGFRSHCG